MGHLWLSSNGRTPLCHGGDAGSIPASHIVCYLIRSFMAGWLNGKGGALQSAH